MIISASRRTDIPAFYPQWLINRIRSGYCVVPNPFNRTQITRVSLLPEDVDAIVFWTRHARPLFPYLGELNQRGYRYYFQYTLLNNPRLIDHHTPALENSLATFRELSALIGPDRVIWRYDPVVHSTITPPAFHLQTFSQIAAALRGYTLRVVFSFMTLYAKARKRMDETALKDTTLIPYTSGDPWFGDFVRGLVAIAQENDMQLRSCASELDLTPYGVQPGKCVDDELLARVWGLDVNPIKDPYQRAACGCVVSKDIGMYDSCLFGCQYCYATSSFQHARENYDNHDPESPSLLGRYDVNNV